MNCIGISVFRDGKVSNKGVASSVWDKSFHETLQKQWKEAHAAHMSITEKFTDRAYWKAPTPEEDISEVMFDIFALCLRDA